jgi:hypothetical protein
MSYLGHVLPLGSIRKFNREICFKVAQAPPAWYTVRPIIGCKQYIVTEHENERYLHFVNQSTCFPAQCIEDRLKGSPEVFSKQTTGESVKPIKR